MRIQRRRFLQLCAGVVPAASRVAKGQTYPTRPVRIVVGFPAGGGVDITARLIGQALSERLGQQFIIDDRPGASSNIGTEVVVRAAPDGYTLLLSNSVNAINASLYERLRYNFIRDVAPIAPISSVPNVMVVSPSFSAKTIPEFIVFARANPGRINMASSGNGATEHIFGELFKMATGLNMVHVPYRGAALALTDVIAAQVQVMFATMPAAIQYIRTGNLRALAVTTAGRSKVLPEVPALGEVVPGYDASAWYGLSAPKKTPAEIIERLNLEVGVALSNPKLKQRLAELGAEPLHMTAAEFEKFVSDEIEKWGKVIKFANIKAE